MSQSFDHIDRLTLALLFTREVMRSSCTTEQILREACCQDLGPSGVEIENYGRFGSDRRPYWNKRKKLRTANKRHARCPDLCAKAARLLWPLPRSVKFWPLPFKSQDTVHRKFGASISCSQRLKQSALNIAVTLASLPMTEEQVHSRSYALNQIRDRQRHILAALVILGSYNRISYPCFAQADVSAQLSVAR